MTIKKYGIGYTIFEFDGRTKKPILQFKPIPGNMEHAMHLLEKRIKKMQDDLYKNKPLLGLCLYSLAYGFAIRVLLSL